MFINAFIIWLSYFIRIYTQVTDSISYDYDPEAETGLVLLAPGTTNNSVNVIQTGLKIIH